MHFMEVLLLKISLIYITSYQNLLFSDRINIGNITELQIVQNSPNSFFLSENMELIFKIIL